MSSSRLSETDTSALDPDGIDSAETEFPSLFLLVGRIHEVLARRRQLGLLSLSVLRRDGQDDESWEDYDSVLRAISIFVSRFSARRLRGSDDLLDPIVAGNMLVVLLAPPRSGRDLDQTDLTRVRHRLSTELEAYLRDELATTASERYSVHVGGTLIRHDSAVDTRRILFRGLEEAFADAMQQRRRAGLRDAVHLQRILRDKQVTTVYQPLVDLVDRRVIGYEALARLPRAQYPGPDVMIRVAHENGALWAIERLCRQQALATLPSLDPSQKLFLNIEPDSFLDPSLVQPEFRAELARCGLDPHRIVLEFTEHAAVKDFAVLRRVLDEVRELGFGLAMDDVGSGYAGLQTLAELRPDYLKIDMALVRNVHEEPIKRELISTICRFTERTGITMVAEGVETHEELEALMSMGVRCAQGYLLGRPDSPPRHPQPDGYRFRQSFGIPHHFRFDAPNADFAPGFPIRRHASNGCRRSRDLRDRRLCGDGTDRCSPESIPRRSREHHEDPRRSVVWFRLDAFRPPHSPGTRHDPRASQPRRQTNTPYLYRHEPRRHRPAPPSRSVCTFAILRLPQSPSFAPRAASGSPAGTQKRAWLYFAFRYRPVSGRDAKANLWLFALACAPVSTEDGDANHPPHP